YKVIRYLIFTILIVASLAVFAVPFVFAQQYESENWFPVRVDGKTGYIDRTGKIVLEPKYDGASYFSEGLGRVSVGRDTIITEGFSQGFIDETGKMVIKPKWDIVTHFSDGLAAVGFDQTKQKIEINGRFLGYTSASHTWYRWGFIDKTGNAVIDTKFSDITEFRDGIAAANTDPYQPKYGFIDKKGNWVIKPQFENANQFSDGLARVFINGKYGFIDKSGKLVIKPEYSWALNFSDGLACVRIGGDVIKPYGMSITNNFGEHAFIDKNGKVVIKLKNAECRSSFSEGLARFEEIGKYGEGFIDRTGKVVIKPFGGGQSDFSDGLKFVILDGGKLGFISRDGNLAFKLPFGKADDFYRGLAQVCESYDFESKCGYIDKTGKVIWEPSK
ncbi:MAG: WG repeat-containing protein, partial [Acidobacteria bacterium]|nr:WG repeat-containing protein [Acidobacteriota bacterium]